VVRKVEEGNMVAWWWGGRVDDIPTHHIILACSELEPLKVSHEGSSVGMGEDVVQLRQDARGVSLVPNQSRKENWSKRKLMTMMTSNLTMRNMRKKQQPETCSEGD
jgi:hypothetical protein